MNTLNGLSLSELASQMSDKAVELRDALVASGVRKEDANQIVSEAIEDFGLGLYDSPMEKQ